MVYGNFDDTQNTSFAVRLAWKELWVLKGIRIAKEEIL